jgi:hypothetical protein
VPDRTGIDALDSLDRLNLTGMTGGEMLDVLKAWDRQAAWLAARTHRVMAVLSEQLLREFRADPITRTEDYPLMIAEIGTATRQSEFRVGKRWSAAHQLTRVLTETLAALQAGEISEYQAQLISEETFSLDPDDARDVEARVLPCAGRQTPAQLGRSVRTAIGKVDPDAANRRAKKAVKERDVWTRPLPDGMAELGATGPAAAIHAMFGALDARAEKPRLDDDTRLIGARRFDALLDSVLGAGAGRSVAAGRPASTKPDRGEPDHGAPDHPVRNDVASDDDPRHHVTTSDGTPTHVVPDDIPSACVISCDMTPTDVVPHDVLPDYIPMAPDSSATADHPSPRSCTSPWTYPPCSDCATTQPSSPATAHCPPPSPATSPPATPGGA